MGTRLFSVLALVALTACGPRDARYNPLHFHITGAAAPPDVVLPSGTKPGSKVFGLTTTAPDFEGLCCAADAHVSVPVRKDRRASTLVVSVYVPAGVDERLRVTFPNGSTAYQDSAKHGKKGLVALSFPLPPTLRNQRGMVPVRLDATHAPYVLVSIFFE